MSCFSTKSKLLKLIDDVDCISREFIEIITGKDNSLNPENLVELLIEKDKEIRQVLEDVEHQVEVQQKIDILKNDIHKSDEQILSVQRHLREAEVLLKTALYYSRRKLESMEMAASNPVDPEEVIRYAHKISASHGAVAPENWTKGDPRRPYPTDEEMRRGFLGHLDDNGYFKPSVFDAFATANFHQINGVGRSPLHVPTCSTPSSSTQHSQSVPATNSRPIPHTSQTRPGSQIPWQLDGQNFLSSQHQPAMPPPNQPPGVFATNLTVPGANMVSSPGMSRNQLPSTQVNLTSLLSQPAHPIMTRPSGLPGQHGQMSMNTAPPPIKIARTEPPGENVELMSSDSSSNSSSSDDNDRAESLGNMD